MRLKLYCNRYEHFKDALVCSVNCAYRTRCRDFALFYDERREDVDGAVAAYYESHRAPAVVAADAPAQKKSSRSRPLPVVVAVAPAATAPKLVEAVDMSELIRLEVKREMAQPSYIWIDKDGRAELLAQDEVLRRAARGQKPQTIYKVAQEMELRFQLVPRKRIEKARAAEAVEAERAAARRAARRAPVRAAAATTAPDEIVSAPPAPRRARRRAAKPVSER